MRIVLGYIAILKTGGIQDVDKESSIMKLKSCSYAILFINNIILFFSIFNLFSCTSDRPTINPTLKYFFGNLDLGMHSTKIRNVDPGLVPTSSYPSFMGKSQNNPALRLSIVVTDQFEPISIFTPFGKIRIINAELDSTFLSNGGEASFKYYLDYFQNKVKEDYSLYISKKLGLEFYIWHFENYSFQIRRVLNKNERAPGALRFSVYYDTTGIDPLVPLGQFIKVNSNGDTIGFIP